MRALIRRLADQGITVLLSSHQLPEIQELCDRVAIVDSGRVVYEGALSDLRRSGGAGYRLRTTDDARALRVLQAQPGVRRAAGDEHGLSFEAEERDLGALTPALAAQDVGILALTPELATLEDLFFRLTEGDGGRPRGDPDGSRGAAPAAAPATAAAGGGTGEATMPVGASEARR
jgi:ABC-2 type transport system ATP-binding protein